MFNRVLIAEDHESASISVRKALSDLGVIQADYVFYCDDALKRCVHAQQYEEPYDLLITDLSFEDDEYTERIKGGEELIEQIKAVQPGIKVLVFSAENKRSVIDHLMNDLAVNAYVRKARRDIEELKRAMADISSNKRYLNPDLKHQKEEVNTYEFSDYDLTLIRQLAHGMKQKDIPAFLEEQQIKPYGLSSVEKRLGFMRDVLGLTKNEQLIAFCKDLGII